MLPSLKAEMVVLANRFRSVDLWRLATSGAQACRLMASILEPAHAPADELGARYQEYRELETEFDELATRLRQCGRRQWYRVQVPAARAR